jgi:branched-chain amino acid transport system substrate-binding protein
MTRPLVLAAALVLVAGCKSEDVILVGEVGSMTGPEASFGQSTHRGIQLAVEEVNARGGVKGKKLRVKAIDDQGKPEEAAAATTALISRDKVVAIVGEVASTRSKAMAPIAQKQQVPMVSPSSTNETVTMIGDYIFRVCFIDPFQGRVMARFARETLKLDRAAILRDIRSDYSVGLAKSFEAAFKELGGTIVGDESYASNDVDFRAQLTTLKGRDPQAIFVPGYYSDVPLVARQARELGLSAPLLGGDGWDSSKLYEVGGPALDGSYFSNHYSADDPSPRIRQFLEAYRKKYAGEVPDGLAAQGYDAMMVLAEAMARAPDLSGPALRDALARTADYDGVTGRITIDAQRNAMKPAVVLKVAAGGKFEFVERVQP